MVFVLLLVACGADVDGDGVVDRKDCAPENGALSPSAAELCNGADDNCDGEIDEGLPRSTWYRDTDGDGFGDQARQACAAPDGFVASGGDCDDHARWVYPDAPEVCGGGDDDCDGLIDEDALDATPWYVDADGDGWGDDASVLSACTEPEGAARTGGDCDDHDAAISPDASEQCGGADEDCDGLVDMDDPDVAADPEGAGGIAGYRDADGDGWGGEPGGYCPGEGEGWSETDGDCDDGDPSVYPDAPEDCLDGVDHDCDGRPGAWDADGDGFTACEDCDDSDYEAHAGAPERCNGRDDDCDGRTDVDAVDAREWHLDADLDGYGDPASTVAACERPLGYLVDGTDCNDAVARVSPGQPENCRTADDDNCDGLLDEADAQGCTAWYIDADGDGWGDPSGRLCQCEPPGGPYVVQQGDDCVDSDADIHPEADDPCGDALDADCDDDDACSADDLGAVAVGPLEESYAGLTLTADVDVTGDGVVDLVVGTGGFAPETSAALVYAGPVGTDELALTASLTGMPEDATVGGLATAADVTGDGIGDVLVGDSDGEYGGSRHSGLVHLFAGPILGSADTRSATLTVFGQASDALGWGADIHEDLDGDGTTDLAVGGLLDAYGAYCGWPGTLTGVASTTEARWCVEGNAATGGVGNALDAGDVNGDGVADLVYGMNGDDTVAWMEGPISGFVLASDHDGAYVLDDPHERTFGLGHTLLADLDGDGLADLVAGSESTTWYFGAMQAGTGGTVAGAAATFLDTKAYEYPTPAAAVDLDGDGQDELVLGAPEIGDGRALVYAAPLSGTLGALDALVAYEGDGAGRAVAAGGDLDGDGRPDALVGADLYTPEGGSHAGAVLVLPGAVLP